MKYDHTLFGILVHNQDQNHPTMKHHQFKSWCKNIRPRHEVPISLATDNSASCALFFRSAWVTISVQGTTIHRFFVIPPIRYGIHWKTMAVFFSLAKTLTLLDIHRFAVCCPCKIILPVAPTKCKMHSINSNLELTESVKQNLIRSPERFYFLFFQVFVLHFRATTLLPCPTTNRAKMRVKATFQQRPKAMVWEQLLNERCFQ